MRTCWPVSSRSFGSARLPFSRTSPLRMMRWMWLNDRPGNRASKKRSSRMPASSAATVTVCTPVAPWGRRGFIRLKATARARGDARGAVRDRRAPLMLARAFILGAPSRLGRAIRLPRPARFSELTRLGGPLAGFSRPSRPARIARVFRTRRRAAHALLSHGQRFISVRSSVPGHREMLALHGQRYPGGASSFRRAGSVQRAPRCRARGRPCTSCRWCSFRRPSAAWSA